MDVEYERRSVVGDLSYSRQPERDVNQSHDQPRRSFVYGSVNLPVS